MNNWKLAEVIVFAGPNGSGKSSLTKLIKPVNMIYINADDIKRVNMCSDLEAALFAEEQRENCVKNGQSFCFETVMSTTRNLDLLKRAKENNFFVRSHIVVTIDSRINVSRVRGRVESGGHDVPEDKIISRYTKSLNLVKDVVKVSDICNIYDNSSLYPFRFFKKRKSEYFYQRYSLWPLEQIKKLTGIDNIQHKKLNEAPDAFLQSFKDNFKPFSL